MKLLIPTRFLSISISVAVTVSLFTYGLTSIQAEALADFSGGLGDDGPNQFRGSGGQGWIDGWSTRFSQESEGNFSFAVEKDAAFGDSVDVLRTSRGGETGFVVFKRTLDPAELDPTQEHVVSFQIRLDEFTGADDQPFLFTVAGFSQEKKISESPDNSAWCLIVSDRNKKWAIHYGGADGNLRRMDSDMSFEIGVVYAIKVFLQPNEHLFRVSISSGENFYESPQLASPSATVHSETLSFGGWVSKGGPGTFRWSLGPVKVEKN